MGGLYRVSLWVGPLTDWGTVLSGTAWGLFGFPSVDPPCLSTDVLRLLLGWGSWLRGVVLAFSCLDFAGSVGSLSIKLTLDGVFFLTPCELEGGGSSVGVGGRSTEGVPLLEPRYCDPQGVPLRPWLMRDPAGETSPCLAEVLSCVGGVFSILCDWMEVFRLE